MEPNHRQNAYKHPTHRRKHAVTANLFAVGLWLVVSQRFRVWRFTPIREATIISLSLEVSGWAMHFLPKMEPDQRTENLDMLNSGKTRASEATFMLAPTIAGILVENVRRLSTCRDFLYNIAPTCRKKAFA